MLPAAGGGQEWDLGLGLSLPRGPCRPRKPPASCPCPLPWPLLLALHAHRTPPRVLRHLLRAAGCRCAVPGCWAQNTGLPAELQMEWQSYVPWKPGQGRGMPGPGEAHAVIPHAGCWLSSGWHAQYPLLQKGPQSRPSPVSVLRPLGTSFGLSSLGCPGVPGKAHPAVLGTVGTGVSSGLPCHNHTLRASWTDKVTADSSREPGLGPALPLRWALSGQSDSHSQRQLLSPAGRPAQHWELQCDSGGCPHSHPPGACWTWSLPPRGSLMALEVLCAESSAVTCGSPLGNSHSAFFSGEAEGRGHDRCARSPRYSRTLCAPVGRRGPQRKRQGDS